MSSSDDVLKEATAHHRRAMEEADAALALRSAGDTEQAAEHFRTALAEERAAAELVMQVGGPEPSRSVLFRSAAALALDAGLPSEAEELATRGLSGEPPPSIANELREVLALARNHGARRPTPHALKATAFHAKYWAHCLRLQQPQSEISGLSRTIGNARVDMNPHQIDAALFALRSPYTKGALLADEVGLGKTIEAGLILAQRWAERRRRILLIVPATLRKQWQAEMEDKFFLPSLILEGRTFNELHDSGGNPFRAGDRIVICSYQFAYAKRTFVRDVPWDLVVVDEAHRLRSIYKDTKTAVGIVDAIRPAHKLLLTATPLQNTLLELYGLVSIIDPDVFGSLEDFQETFLRGDVAGRDEALRSRLRTVCTRTLRRHVRDYVRFTERFPFTVDFTPSPEETRLYDDISAYLQREVLVALPNTRRKLITLILRKLLASSSAAIGSTLQKFIDRLKTTSAGPAPSPDPAAALADDFETIDELQEEWTDDGNDGAAQGDATASVPPPAPVAPLAEALAEASELEKYVQLARMIVQDAKAVALRDALPKAFDQAAAKGGPRKAVIFTESRRTQEYLFKLLTENGYAGQIVLMNGSNNDPVSKKLYDDWKAQNEKRWSDVTSGSRSADMKAAIVEAFRTSATILLATESAAEGVNLQFCSIVVNYDLPWNPQRIEQRIGRCHRYGQKNDVLVVNFLNRKNAADQRVFQLLDQKFNLFRGIFGASDEILGTIESGVDFEKKISEIYQTCRSTEEIQSAFDALQRELEDQIAEGMATARRALLDNFDSEVHERLRVHKDAVKTSLDTQQRLLLDLARLAFRDRASFDDSEPRFVLKTTDGLRAFHLDWQRAEDRGEIFFRQDHPEAVAAIDEAVALPLPAAEVVFDYDAHASALGPYVGKSGWLDVSKLKATVLGRVEEHLVVAAIDDSGRLVPPDLATKLFSLTGEASSTALGAAPPGLAQVKQDLCGQELAGADTRGESLFSEEVERIDARTEDLKTSVERRIKEMDREIAAKKKEVRRAASLQQKLDLQKEIAILQRERHTKRREYFDEQDRIQADHDALITRMEDQLKDRETEIETILTMRWHLRAPSQTPVR